ncbi:MAG: MetQ/NlpA family ABC transporter substrate-binding protein [Clostridiales bacterium]|nr:MetQ/NlpA family ABC transporter substrate-binding protein [Candidatus Crickella caballi]
MKNIKKLSVITLAIAFTLAFCTACGGSGDSADAEKTIKVAATPSPHAEILYEIQDELAEEGWTLEVVEFEDYVQPNEAVSNGECDANYFQHQPYLDQYNEENGTDIATAGVIHYEPLGVYKGTKDAFDALADGDKIGVPNDVTNEARALQLLADNGVITLKEGVGLEATKTDIVDNPKNLEIVELEAATLPASLPDLALAVINGNYAIGGGLSAADAIAYESSDSEAAQTFANIIACAAGNEKSDKIVALVEALQDDDVKEFIDEKYAGAVKAMF